MQLIDIFTNLLYFTTVNREFDFGQFDMSELQKRYHDMIVDAEQGARQSGITDFRWQHALFAIAAWVDEVIMISDWPHRNLWQRQSLQRTYFHTANGGVEFYTRLKSIDSTETALLELYDVVMSLGFKGVLFRDCDTVKRREIIECTMQQLASSCDMSIPKRLFCSARSTADLGDQQTGLNWAQITRIAFFAAPPVLFTLVYIILYVKLSALTDALLKLF